MGSAIENYDGVEEDLTRCLAVLDGLEKEREGGDEEMRR